MIEALPQYHERPYADIVYLLYQKGDNTSATKIKTISKLSYLDALRVSAGSYINSILRDYFVRVHRPRAFDFSASCSNSFHQHEETFLPEIHIYTNMNIQNKNCTKLFIHPIQPIIDLCPVAVTSEQRFYVPALKGAAVFYHSQNFSDKTHSFILSDVDIVFGEYKSPVDPSALYLCGLEYQPLFSFLCFSVGLSLFSNDGAKKERDIAAYQQHADQLKIPLQSMLFNNGIIHVPFMQAKTFYDYYYSYLQELEQSDLILKWPYPFWTAEMFATNYAVQQMSLRHNVVLRRFDPDAFSIIHDINSQYGYYFDSILALGDTNA